MVRIKAPSGLPDLVKSKFAQACSEGELHYFPTQVTILRANNIPFQLRFSPALANKPKAPPKEQTYQPTKPFDPFAEPPAALRIVDLGPSHFLVLNKFAVVPEHFILATTEFKAQTHVLEEADLAATVACIEAYEQTRRDEHEKGHRDGAGGGGDGLYAFFNCGEHSGASQPHRHIQLLPIARMRDGLDEDSAWEVLANRLPSRQDAPFVTFAETIHPGLSSSELHAIYLRLYRQACRAVASYGGAVPSQHEAPPEGEARISYNMAMTSNVLVVCPRLSEGTKIMTPDGDILGNVSLNGTLLAGTALVKSELEWEALKKDQDELVGVLKGIGIPSEFTQRNKNGL